jgi:hypothetical protein
MRLETGINGLRFSYNYKPLAATIDTNLYYRDANYTTGIAAYAVALGTFSSSFYYLLSLNERSFPLICMH